MFCMMFFFWNEFFGSFFLEMLNYRYFYGLRFKVIVLVIEFFGIFGWKDVGEGEYLVWMKVLF